MKQILINQAAQLIENLALRQHQVEVLRMIAFRRLVRRMQDAGFHLQEGAEGVILFHQPCKTQIRFTKRASAMALAEAILLHTC